MTTPALALDDADDLGSPAFWSRLVPWLACSASLELGGHQDSLGEAKQAELRHCMRREGFFVATELFDARRASRLRRGVEEVRSRFGHEVFSLMYDEFWLALARVKPLVSAVLGGDCRVVPLPYVNYVSPGDAGFAPHRDRNGDAVTGDGLPNIATAWISLTDAGTDRACLAVLPAHLDPNFPDRLEALEIRDLRDLRAVPVPAGSLICFNQGVLHWGTRNASSEPRVSFAFELERLGLSDARQPAIDLGGPLTFTERLGFVGAVVGLLSQSNIEFSDSDLSAARRMCRSAYGAACARFFEATEVRGGEKTRSAQQGASGLQ